MESYTEGQPLKLLERRDQLFFFVCFPERKLPQFTISNRLRVRIVCERLIKCKKTIASTEGARE